MKTLLRGLAALLLVMVAAAAQAACSVPNVFVPNTVIQSAAMNANFAAVVACANGFTSPFASSQAALASLPVSVGTVIVTSPALPPATYVAQAGACGLSGGDGGSQIPITATGGGCWVLTPQSVYEIGWWGLSTPIQFYVNAATGDDGVGANFCVISAQPCKTLSSTQTQVQKFNQHGTAPTVNIAAGTYQGIRVAGALINSASVVTATGISEVFLGAGCANTTITDTLSQQAVMQAAAAMQFSIEGMTISPPSGDDGLFAAGQGATINVNGTGGHPVCFNGLSSGANAMHIEGNNRIIIANGGSYTFSGAFNNVITVGEGSIFLVQPNVSWTCSPGLTIASNLITITQGMSIWDQGSFSGCGGLASPPNNFTLQQNAVLDCSFAGGTCNFPFNPGYLGSGARIAPADTPCVGGNTGCGNSTAVTGLGVGGSGAIVGAASLYGVSIDLTAGSSGTSASGAVWIQFANFHYQPASSPTHYAPCVASPIHSGSTGNVAWANGATAQVDMQIASVTGGEGVRIVWANNGINLTANGVYGLALVCNS